MLREEKEKEKMANRPSGYGLTAEMEAKVFFKLKNIYHYCYVSRKQPSLMLLELKKRLIGWKR